MAQTSADRNIDHLYPDFAVKVKRIQAAWNHWAETHMPGYELALIEGLRSASYQNRLWQQGRNGHDGEIVTQKDGYSSLSGHQSAMSGDLVPVSKSNGAVNWDAPAIAWGYLGHCARAEGLDSGNDWTTFKDSAHVEWKRSDKAAYIKARAWLKSKGLAS